MNAKTLLTGVAALLVLASTPQVALAAGKPKPPPPDTTPSSPPARTWHTFAGNGGLDSASSRLYLFGGSDSNGGTLPGDLWAYDALADKWTLVVLSRPAKPAYRQGAPLSCGNGKCVTSGSPPKVLEETWVFTEATSTWWKMNCTKYFCPTSRTSPAMAYDAANGNHLLFGGEEGETGLLRGDTLTFDAGTRRWTVHNPDGSPDPRQNAAAAYVPGVGVVLFGGTGTGLNVFCDMHAWTGTDWTPVGFDWGQEHPCLRDHSMAWDGDTSSLLVVAGYSDASYGKPNATQWRFKFDAAGRSGTWSKAEGMTCTPIGGTDGTVHAGAKMAFDVPTQTQVYFGGREDVEGVGSVTYGNTVECY